MKNYLLTIDSGNTNCKSKFFELPNKETAFKSNVDFDVIISDVANIELKSFIPLNENKNNIINIKDFIQEKIFLDMPLHYTTTVGADRVAQAYYCFHHFNENILLIDAGTFVTVDLVTPQGFQGGYIYPGLELMLESFQKGKNLPALTARDFQSYLNQHNQLPHSTNEAILGSLKLTYEAFMAQPQFENAKIILTGGSAEQFSQIFKTAVLDKELNFKSLLFIYQQTTKEN
ncbi:MAG: type III pantothenate kinase [Bacteriovoracaceae bacterium]|nr:type III pantothenate kinase [Bacteriovoracaceae bacterium]